LSEVPFALPRSSIVMLPIPSLRRACRRETDWSGITIWACEVRPMRSSPLGGRVCVAEIPEPATMRRVARSTPPLLKVGSSSRGSTGVKRVSHAAPRRHPGKRIETDGDEPERAETGREREALEGPSEHRAQEIRGEGVRWVLGLAEARGEDERSKE